MVRHLFCDELRDVIVVFVLCVRSGCRSVCRYARIVFDPARVSFLDDGVEWFFLDAFFSDEAKVPTHNLEETVLGISELNQKIKIRMKSSQKKKRAILI